MGENMIEKTENLREGGRNVEEEDAEERKLEEKRRHLYRQRNGQEKAA